MARTPSGSVSMHRPCANTPPVRVRGDPTLDPTLSPVEEAPEIDFGVFRCYGVRRSPPLPHRR